MRVLFIALMALMPTVSLWAQGQIVAVGPSSQIQDYIMDGNLLDLVVTLPPLSPPSQLPTVSNFPLPEAPSALAVEAITATINLTDVNCEAPVNLSSATIQLGQVNFSTGAGIEASRPTTGILQFPSMPPTEGSVIIADNWPIQQMPDGIVVSLASLLPPFDGSSPNQALSIQPAPEPSTFAIGGLALGLIALVRLNKRQQVLKR